MLRTVTRCLLPCGRRPTAKGFPSLSHYPVKSLRPVEWSVDAAMSSPGGSPTAPDSSSPPGGRPGVEAALVIPVCVEAGFSSRTSTASQLSDGRRIHPELRTHQRRERLIPVRRSSTGAITPMDRSPFPLRHRNAVKLARRRKGEQGHAKTSRHVLGQAEILVRQRRLEPRLEITSQHLLADNPVAIGPRGSGKARSGRGPILA